MHWERIETVAESFGDLDPRMDLREADLDRGPGVDRLAPDREGPVAAGPATSALTRSSGPRSPTTCSPTPRTLDQRVADLDYTVDQIGNGSKGLLDEVATGKITGEEEIWSHTDLYDFQANVDGARVGYEGSSRCSRSRTRSCRRQIGDRFDGAADAARPYRSARRASSSTTTLTEPQVKELSDAVNALSEPLVHR